MSRPDIAMQAGVNRWWLEKFDQGVITNPTANNLFPLLQWLTANEAKFGPAPSEARDAA